MKRLVMPSFLLPCALTLGFTGAILVTAKESKLVVVCDSVSPHSVQDPRDPYLREVVVGCTLGDVNGPEVEVRFID